MFNIYSVAIKSILRELVVTAEYTLIGLDHGNNNSSGGKATKCNRYANLLLYACINAFLNHYFEMLDIHYNVKSKVRIIFIGVV